MDNTQCLGFLSSVGLVLVGATYAFVVGFGMVQVGLDKPILDKNVISPEKEELEKLTGEMLIPFDSLTDPLDIDERARIETGFLL